MEFSHIPVLFEPTMELLDIKPDGIYVDCTLGGGGHTEGILKRLGENGRVIGLDQDMDAISSTKERLSAYGDKLTIIKTNFSDVANAVRSIGVEEVDGILYDIGVSSHQLDVGERGFSYMQDAPLDMRMDQSSDIPTAADLVNNLPEEELANIIYLYGEERYSRRIASSICYCRAKEPILTTLQLANAVRRAIPKSNKEDQHPAKRTFQAIRIAVNKELEVLEKGLAGGMEILKPGGRMAVITFHSLEDRIVKEQFRTWAKGCTCPPELPVCVCGKKPSVKLINRKPITATEEELEFNHRAKCAKLRVCEKLPLED